MIAAEVSAVIVTRGDVDLTVIHASLVAFDEVVIWNNALEEDLGVFGRYMAIRQAHNNVIYVQDDDCLIPAEKVVAAYEPERLVANMPRGRWRDYPDSALVGWGAVFDRHLPDDAFIRWDGEGPVDHSHLSDFYMRTCDVIFSALTPRTIIDVGFQHLSWAEDPARAMFKQPGHKRERDRMLGLARSVRTWPDDDRRI